VSLSTHSIVSSIKYNNNDRPPFIIQVQPVDDADVASFHPLHISRIFSQISPRDIVEIRKTGRSRVIAEMRNREAANRLIANDQLLSLKLKAFYSRASRVAYWYRKGCPTGLLFGEAA